MPKHKRVHKKPILGRFLNVLSLTLVNMGLISGTVYAQQEISLQDAVLLTLEKHADLKSYAYAYKRSQWLVEQAGVGSPYTINAGINEALGTGQYSGISSLQTQLSISWLLEKSQIDASVNVANKESLLVAYEKESRALDLAGETASIYITLLSQKEQLSLAKVAEIQAKKALNIITERVKVAKSNVIDQLRAKANLSKKSLLVEDLQHEIEASKSQLAAQWQGDSTFTVSGSLTSLPNTITLDDAITKLKENPKVQVFAARQLLAQSKINLAKVNNKPAWQVSTGIMRNEAVDDFGFSASISIPLGSDNRNKGKIQSLKAEQTKEEVQANALVQRLSTQLLLLSHQIKHNTHVVEGLSAETIPALEQANSEAEKAYLIGSYRYSDWYDIQQELLETQSELIQAYTNVQQLNIEFERITGASGHIK